MAEAVAQCSVKEVFLEISQNSEENTCARVSFLIKLQAWALQLYKRETLAQVFSFEFCEISKKTFFYRTALVAASIIDSSLSFSNRVNLWPSLLYQAFHGILEQY